MSSKEANLFVKLRQKPKGITIEFKIAGNQGSSDSQEMKTCRMKCTYSHPRSVNWSRMLIKILEMPSSNFTASFEHFGIRCIMCSFFLRMETVNPV